MVVAATSVEGCYEKFRNEYIPRGQDTIFTTRWNLPKMDALGGAFTGGDAHQYSTDINAAHGKGVSLANFLRNIWDVPGLQLTFKIPLYFGMDASTGGGGSAISHVYISPSSQDGGVCQTGLPNQDYSPKHEEGQMWKGFAEPFLLPKLKEVFGAGGVVLAPNSLGPDISNDNYSGRVDDAIKTQKATPGKWVYLSVHSNAGETDPTKGGTPCNMAVDQVAKGCCYTGWKYMSVLVHESKSPFAIKLAETICKHLDALRVDVFLGGYGGGKCQVVKYTSGLLELSPSNGLSMPSLILELTFHDTIQDTMWFDAHRTDLSKAVADALVECKDGCP